jgi:hypothetical protein
MKVSKKINYICIFFGLIIICIGIFLIWTSFLIGGFNWEFIPAVILTSSGFAILLCVTFFNIMKTKNAKIICTISTIIIFLFSFVFLYINLSGSPYYTSQSPIVNCEIVFYNDTANMIKWIVTQTYGIIKIENLGYRLISGTSGYNEIEANIIYYDSDDSSSLTKGDIFEVYAPYDGIYNFEIIDWSMNLLVCSYKNSY